MISSSCWVPRGFAAEFPETYQLDDAEMERISKMAQLELADAQEELQEAQAAQPDTAPAMKSQIDIDDDLKEYDLEHYDDEATAVPGQAAAMFPGLSADVQYHENENGDDYLTLPDETERQEDKQEMQIYPTDNLVLATRTEDDVSYLDVYVYDDGAGAPDGSQEEAGDKLDRDVANGMVREANLYVHHDLMLPSFPLCVEWVNFRPGGGDADNIGNFAAIGTFDPQIEIWNLDCVDKAFPDMILGEPQQNSLASLSAKKKKKKSKGKEHVTTHHTDAVLSLTHNKTHRNVLTSTSADKTVKLWDLGSGTAVKSYNSIHSGKIVAASQWHATEASVLLTGGYDACAALSDIRVSNDSDMTKRYAVGSGQEVESVRWGAQPEIFYCGTDNGNVYCFDIRVQSKPLWTLHAHDSGISSLDVNPHVPGMLVTTAMSDKIVKLWKCPQEAGGPSMVLSRDFGVGNVLTTSFAGDVEVAGHLTVGGVTGALKMWDAFSNRAVRSSFQPELKQLQKQARERAQTAGFASRIARKYQGQRGEDIISVEAGKLDDSESEGEDEAMGDGVEEIA